MEVWIQLLISNLLYFSLVILSFSLFKIPLIEHHRIITLMSLILGTIHFYLRFLIKVPLFGTVVLCWYIVLLMVLKRYPIFYSLIVCGIAFLVVNLIDISVMATALHFGLVEEDPANLTLIHWVMLNVVSIVVVSLITILLKLYNIGFSFIIKQFSTAQVLKQHNFIWASIIVFSVAVSQAFYFVTNVRSYELYILLGVVILALFVILVVAYYKNKKALKDRYGR